MECYIFSYNCHFKKHCSELNPTNTTMQIQLNNYDFEIKLDDLLVDTTYQGSTTGECTLGVMAEQMFNEDLIWHAGSLLMQNHYFVYDQTPNDEKNQGFVQIGIAERNVNSDVFNDQYPCNISSNDISLLETSKSYNCP